MQYSAKRSMKSRQPGTVEVAFSVSGSAATPAASGQDAMFVESVVDNGVGDWTITLKDKSLLDLVIKSLVSFTPGAILSIDAVDEETVTVLAHSRVGVKAQLAVQDITYVARQAGLAGNSITIAYTAGGTAGSEVVSVVGNAISVQIEDGVSTATQVLAAINASAVAQALISASITGTAGDAQVAAAAAPLAGGADVVALDADFSVCLNFASQVPYYF